ncbi:hypothetical protein EC12741_2309 [Escherichia coli 1.2741]|nr:hypothetical protein HMPREF9346_05061 [Escherichia coli MS 119-7]EIG82136.1 hypothetical protein EC12741_2309 [Escherichia coli 1.2741]
MNIEAKPSNKHKLCGSNSRYTSVLLPPASTYRCEFNGAMMR